MAKKAVVKDNGRGETVGGYFRAVFLENPQFLEERSNDEIVDRWLADHPSESEVPNRIRNILANVKSVMRKDRREAAGLKKSKQPRASVVAQEMPAEDLAAPAGTMTGNEGLEHLEEAIDDCLTLAKNLDRDLLADVINYLRRARNQVVWKLGE
jgi:hypothetical protein